MLVQLCSWCFTALDLHCTNSEDGRKRHFPFLMEFADHIPRQTGLRVCKHIQDNIHRGYGTWESVIADAMNRFKWVSDLSASEGLSDGGCSVEREGRQNRDLDETVSSTFVAVIRHEESQV